MLSRLQIENFVLFAQCEVVLAPGLNVLTGETGAGKSLLLQAVDLITGAKATSSQLRKGAKSARVVAEFSQMPEDIKRLLEEDFSIELDDDTLIVRRVVSADGKSKAYLNDVQVSLSVLKKIGTRLVARHSQHDQRGLTDSGAHRALIDAELADTMLLPRVQENYHAMRKAEKALDALKTQIEKAKEEAYFLKNMVADLRGLDPQEGEETALMESRNRYLNLQKSKEAFEAVLEAIDGGEAVTSRLLSAQRALARAPVDDDTQTQLVEALERALTEVQDVSARVSDYLYSPEEDETSLAEKEDRLFALRAAARKYHVGLEALPEYYKNACAKLDMFESSDVQLYEAERLVEKTRDQYLGACEALAAAREETAKTLLEKVHVELGALNMKDARLQMVQSPLSAHQWAEHGHMQVQFEFAPNKGQGFAALSKIASGGELSRLLLAISVVMKKGATALSVIYDEIDTGTSGAVAEAIGQRLRKLSHREQVIVVTHLPQVAAQANHHVMIEKRTENEHVETHLRPLTQKEREDELARLLSGKVVTLEAKQAAKKLLQQVG